MDECLRWVEMSEQDRHPLLAFQHANYAFAFLSAARTSSTDALLEKGTGVDVRSLSQSIQRRQKGLYSKLQRGRSQRIV